MSFVLFALLACRTSNYPVEVHAVAGAGASPALESLAQPGPIVLETLQSAKGAVSNAGLLDLDDPLAQHIPEEKVPILIMAHLLRHPTGGNFLVDTGVALEGPGELELLAGLTAKVFVLTDTVDLGAALEARGLSLNGVFLTHMHLDHILGLPDVPAGVPIYVGPDEQQYRKAGNGLLRSTYRRALKGRPPLRVPEFSAEIGGLQAVDFFGDGSLWILHTPGHTPGSLVFLVRTTEGPVLLLGDTSHTRWGWENGVAPGFFTKDADGNKASLDALHAVFDGLPGLRVIPGHEL